MHLWISNNVMDTCVFAHKSKTFQSEKNASPDPFIGSWVFDTIFFLHALISLMMHFRFKWFANVPL